MNLTMAFLCITMFVVLIVPLRMGSNKKNKSDIYGNSGWRTLKLKKLRNKKPRHKNRLG